MGFLREAQFEPLHVLYKEFGHCGGYEDIATVEKFGQHDLPGMEMHGDSPRLCLPDAEMLKHIHW